MTRSYNTPQYNKQDEMKAQTLLYCDGLQQFVLMEYNNLYSIKFI